MALDAHRHDSPDNTSRPTLKELLAGLALFAAMPALDYCKNSDEEAQIAHVEPGATSEEENEKEVNPDSTTTAMDSEGK